METKEWALILFTILAQLAVGSFVVLGVVRFIAARTASTEQADKFSDRILLAIGPVVVIGMLASFGHLGNPINAPRAITNLATSWLSREIFSTVLFAGLGAVFSLMQWRKWGSFTLRNVVAVAAAGAGIFLVYAMARVYMIENQASWNTVATPVLFFTTAFLLGSLAVGAAVMANYTYLKKIDPGCAEVQCQMARDALKGIAIAAIILLGIEMVTVPMQLSILAGSPYAGVQGSAGMFFTEFGILFFLRLALAFLGAGLLAALIYRYAANPGRELLVGTLAFSALSLVLVAELMGRYLFYATQSPIGL